MKLSLIFLFNARINDRPVLWIFLSIYKNPKCSIKNNLLKWYQLWRHILLGKQFDSYQDSLRTHFDSVWFISGLINKSYPNRPCLVYRLLKRLGKPIKNFKQKKGKKKDIKLCVCSMKHLCFISCTRWWNDFGNQETQ